MRDSYFIYARAYFGMLEPFIFHKEIQNNEEIYLERRKHKRESWRTVPETVGLVTTETLSISSYLHQLICFYIVLCIQMKLPASYMW